MTDDDLDLQAGEYVIGTLDAAERASFEMRLRQRDREAVRALAAWERRFAMLAFLPEGVEPSDDLWSRIEAQIRAAGVERPAARTHEMPAGDIWRSRNRWRGAALISGGLAAALLVFAVSNRPVPSPNSGIFVAAVNRGGDKPALIVRVDLKTRQVFVRPVVAETPAGKSLELWYIGDGKTPRSMGLVRPVAASLRMPDGTEPDAKGAFAVSLEPEGGSRTGLPSGPVVYSGQLIED